MRFFKKTTRDTKTYCFCRMYTTTDTGKKIHIYTLVGGKTTMRILRTESTSNSSLAEILFYYYFLLLFFHLSTAHCVKPLNTHGWNFFIYTHIHTIYVYTIHIFFYIHARSPVYLYIIHVHVRVVVVCAPEYVYR